MQTKRNEYGIAPNLIHLFYGLDIMRNQPQNKKVSLMRLFYRLLDLCNGIKKKSCKTLNECIIYEEEGDYKF